MWGTTTFTNTLPFSTTVSPTLVASAELIFPPSQPYLKMNVKDSAVNLPSDFIWGLSIDAWQAEGGLMEAGRGPSVVDLAGISPGGDDANVA